jgi:hypothetical protein
MNYIFINIIFIIILNILEDMRNKYLITIIVFLLSQTEYN